MKRTALILCLLAAVLWPWTAQAGGEKTLTASQYFTETHNVPDSAGTGYDGADSVNVTVVFQDGTVTLDSAWYNSGDAQAFAANDNLFLSMQFGDMDGSSGVGSYTVYLRWYDGSGAALDFQDTWSVLKIDTTLNGALINSQKALDSLAKVIDSLEAQDGWIAQQSDVIKSLDSLAKIIDSLEAQDGWVAQQSDLAKTLDSLALIIDSLQSQDGWVAKLPGLWDADDSAAYQGAAGSSPWNATQRDSVLGALADAAMSKYKADVSALALQVDLAKALDSLAQIIDSLQSQDGWVAKLPGLWSADDSAAYQGAAGSSPWNSTQRDSVLAALADAAMSKYKADVSSLALQADLSKALDSLALVIDSLQSQDGWVAQQSDVSKSLDSLAQIIDSLQSQDGWIAQETSVTKALDSLAIVLDSLRSLDDWVARQDSLMKAVEAARITALFVGATPEDYDSSVVVTYPGAWTPNKDSLKIFAFRGAVIDSITTGRFIWDYYVVGGDSTAVADSIWSHRR